MAEEPMTDLSVKYMGLYLKNPVILSASVLTSSVEKVKKLAQNNAAAVVLNSIFEEQIIGEASSISKSGGSINTSVASDDYINYYVKQNSLNNYLKLIEECKKNTDIPVIASVNCISPKSWTEYAASIENAGADALEMNIYILPFDEKKKGDDIEKVYFKIINEVKKKINIPIAVKIGYHFSSIANTIVGLSRTGIKGLVLFNRFMNLDIDIEKMKISAKNILSSPDEIYRSIRWIGLLYDNVSCDLAASTGIHDGAGIIKSLLAGAAAVEIASAVIKNGPGHINTMLDQLKAWMSKHGYNSINDFRGKMSDTKVKNPQVYERAQFMKYYSDYKD
jgi:dihydroorotate dehydrogenase (fumarate)